LGGAAGRIKVWGLIYSGCQPLPCSRLPRDLYKGERDIKWRAHVLLINGKSPSFFSVVKTNNNRGSDEKGKGKGKGRAGQGRGGVEKGKVQSRLISHTAMLIFTWNANGVASRPWDAIARASSPLITHLRQLISIRRSVQGRPLRGRDVRYLY
jgi:hypothetical protein